MSEHYGARFFGEREAAIYDSHEAAMFDPEIVTPVVDTLASLAGDGAALEMGIGTGRVALPLAERGVRVQGIDVSAAMVARLRAKPGSDRIEVAIGDFATTRVDGQFALVYLIFNTIFNLKTQDEQVVCFENAAAHLISGGHFVIELGVPDLQRLPPGQNVFTYHVDARSMSFDVYDVVTQGLTSNHFIIEDGRVSSYPVEGRYVWPSELDLMARLAGMRLRERWGGWKREPFTNLSAAHVSVYQKP
ncbi:MAG: class I SAM-dependent methyltransferase [Candidatus Dormiibacterota bacterium]